MLQHNRFDVTDGHTLIARCLKKLGVTHAYCVSGTPIRETFAYCARIGIRNIGVHTQHAGVMMATAQNYAAGRLCAISILSAGPAVTNAVTGVLVARDNCWPVVILGGRRPLSMQGMGSFQELDAVPIFNSITKWSAVVESTSLIPEYLGRAFEIALGGRPGPVYLDLPEDVLTEFVDSCDVPRLNIPKTPAPNYDAIARAAEILHHAVRPGMIIGKGVRWSEPYDELRSLTDEFGIPFITSPMGRGYLPDDHPLCCNAARGLLQSKADAVLVVGARLDWTFRFGTELGRNAKIIQIDIHQGEIGVNVRPSVGIVGNAKDALRGIIAELLKKTEENPRQRRFPWHAELKEAKKNKHADWDLQMNNERVPMSPYRMLKEIRDALPRDAICVLDGNVFMAAAQQVLPSYLPASRFTSGSNGCIGVGIPFAIGTKLARPDRTVIAICGDTALGFNAMEMETAVRHEIPIIIVVVNNDGNTGALPQKTFYAEGIDRITMFQPGLRYEKIMRLFGGHAEYVEQPDQIRPALVRAFTSQKPACVNIKVDPDVPYPGD